MRSAPTGQMWNGRSGVLVRLHARHVQLLQQGRVDRIQPPLLPDSEQLQPYRAELFQDAAIIPEPIAGCCAAVRYHTTSILTCLFEFALAVLLHHMPVHFSAFLFAACDSRVVWLSILDVGLGLANCRQPVPQPGQTSDRYTINFECFRHIMLNMLRTP